MNRTFSAGAFAHTPGALPQAAMNAAPSALNTYMEKGQKMSCSPGLVPPPLPASPFGRRTKDEGKGVALGED